MDGDKAASVLLQFIEPFMAQYPGESGITLLRMDNIMLDREKLVLRQKNPKLIGIQYEAGYTAPECPQGNNTPASMVYFCGAMLYSLITGVAPPDGRDRLTKNIHLFSENSPLISVVNRAMALRPAERFATLHFFAESLRAYLQSRNTALLNPNRPRPAPAPAPTQHAVSPRADVPKAPPPRAAAPANTIRQAPITTIEVPTAALKKQQAPQRDLTKENTAINTKKNQPQTPPATPPPPPAAAQEKVVAATPPPAEQNAVAPEKPAPVEVYPPPRPVVYDKPEMVPTMVYSTGKKAKKKKYSFLWLVICLVVVVLTVGGFFLYTMAQEDKAETFYAAEQYAEYVATLDSVSWLRNKHALQYNYARARLLIDEGKNEEAVAILTDLGSYADSPALAQEARYQQAEQLLEAGHLQESQTVFESLGDYKESAEKSKKISDYLAAYNEKDAVSQYKAFARLGDFLDSAEKAAISADLVYDYAMELYTAGQFELATETFFLLDGYKDSKVYLDGCNIWRKASDTYAANEKLLPELEALSAQGDMGPILLSDRLFGIFIEGEWEGPNKQKLTVTDSNFRFSDIRSKGKDWVFSQKSIHNGEETLARFAYLNYNEIEVTIEGSDDGAITYTRSK